MKKRVLAVLCAVLLLSALAINAYAVEVPDFDRKGSISIAMVYMDEIVAGGTLTLYRVADVTEDNGDYSFTYTEEFSGCEVSADDPSQSQIAEALLQIIADKALEGTEQAISDQGKAMFQDLQIGLYLLAQETTAPGYSPVSPFLIAVPGQEGGAYVYDVDASPKMSLEPAPTDPTDPTDPSEDPDMPPKLPQTGLNQWQIPVLVIGGVFLFAAGFVLYRSSKKRSYES